MVVGDFAIDADVVVVGAGPGGYAAALHAAGHGKQVMLIEKEAAGGVCLHRGCIPSKALIFAAHQFTRMKKASAIGVMADHVRVDFGKVQSWKGEVVERLTDGVMAMLAAKRIQLVRGEAYFTDERTISVVHGENAGRYRFKHCVIATGSRPVELTHAPFGGRILSSTEALALREIPASLVIVGGGYIGIELGQMFAGFGAKVHILEGTDAIMPGFEREATRCVEQNLKKLDARVYTNSAVLGVRQSENRAEVRFAAQGKEHKIESEYVLVTVGRCPNTDDLGLRQLGVAMTERGHLAVDRQCRTSIAHLYAIGDVVAGPALAHKAAYEGRVAAEAIAGLPTEADYQAMPTMVFSDPEIAGVGLSQAEAERLGYAVAIGKSLYRFNGRALSMNEPEGFAKLVSDQRTGRLLGAQIVGHDASNLIAEIGLAIEMGATLHDVSLTVHAHPTLGEMMAEAAEDALGKSHLAGG